jgi:hypothetical protein
MLRMATPLATRRRPPGHPSAGGAGPPFLPRCAFPQRPRTGQVRQHAHSRRAPGKGTPPHRPWGGVGVWRSLAQGKVRMAPSFPTATKVPFP